MLFDQVFDQAFIEWHKLGTYIFIWPGSYMQSFSYRVEDLFTITWQQWAQISAIPKQELILK